MVMLRSCLIAALISGLIYLCGAFMSASFNIAGWPTALRVVVGLCGLAGPIVGAAYFINTKETE